MANKKNTNVKMGFNDMTRWENNNPGNITYCCEFCGIYEANKPRCNKCEKQE